MRFHVLLGRLAVINPNRYRFFAHKNGEVVGPSGGGNGFPRSLAEDL